MQFSNHAELTPASHVLQVQNAERSDTRVPLDSCAGKSKTAETGLPGNTTHASSGWIVAEHGGSAKLVRQMGLARR